MLLKVHSCSMANMPVVMILIAFMPCTSTDNANKDTEGQHQPGSECHMNVLLLQTCFIITFPALSPKIPAMQTALNSEPNEQDKFHIQNKMYSCKITITRLKEACYYKMINKNTRVILKIIPNMQRSMQIRTPLQSYSNTLATAHNTLTSRVGSSQVNPLKSCKENCFHVQVSTHFNRVHLNSYSYHTFKTHRLQHNLQAPIFEQFIKD